MTPALASNPGIPPSSLMAWLRANASIAGAVLTEFDSAFSNVDFDTPHDDAEAIQEPGIVEAAIAVAQALASLAQAPGAAPIQVRSLGFSRTYVFSALCHDACLAGGCILCLCLLCFSFELCLWIESEQAHQVNMCTICSLCQSTSSRDKDNMLCRISGCFQQPSMIIWTVLSKHVVLCASSNPAKRNLAC